MKLSKIALIFKPQPAKNVYIVGPNSLNETDRLRVLGQHLLGITWFWRHVSAARLRSVSEVDVTAIGKREVFGVATRHGENSAWSGAIESSDFLPLLPKTKASVNSTSGKVDLGIAIEMDTGSFNESVEVDLD